MEPSPSSPQNQKYISVEQFLQNTFRNNSTLLQTSKKASQSPQNEVGQKIKKRDKGFRNRDLHPRERDMKQEVSLHTQKLPHRQGWAGELQDLRGELSSNRCSEGETENSLQRSLLTSTSQQRNSLHTH